MDIEFFLQSAMLGVALAMDACAVSMSNGLNENKMKLNKILYVSFMFAFFQALMPLVGYFVGHAFIEYIEKYIPWIALILLLFLGIKMIVEVIKNKEEDENIAKITFKVVLIQAVATSIDALSVGITISNYKILDALICALIIAIITFVICIVAHYIGKKFGDKFGNKAQIFGGIILIIIGLEIFIKGIFF